jgi:ABC-type lipoprotein release transport system permease subunit
MLLSTLLLALRSIRRNLLRSFLTILGIVIGVSAVITMVTVGNGATLAIQNQISAWAPTCCNCALANAWVAPGWQCRCTPVQRS